MIEVRNFAPVYAKSLYTAELRASPYWPKLARMMKLPDALLTSPGSRHVAMRDRSCAWHIRVAGLATSCESAG